jgi:hypothetical protein
MSGFGGNSSGSGWGAFFSQAASVAKAAASVAGEVYRPAYASKVSALIQQVMGDPLSAESSYAPVGPDLLRDIADGLMYSRLVYDGLMPNAYELSRGSEGLADVQALFVSDNAMNGGDPSGTDIGTLWIVARGTKTGNDVISDSCWIAKTDRRNNFLGEGIDVDIPTGVAWKVDAVFPKIETLLMKLSNGEVSSKFQSQSGPNRNVTLVRRVCFAGHSLGGAIATALHLTFSGQSAHNHIPASTYTIGSPLLLSLPRSNSSSDSLGSTLSSKSMRDLKGQSEAEMSAAGTPNLLGNPNEADYVPPSLRPISQSIHNVIYQLDVVPRLLGPFPLPSYIQQSSLGAYAETIMGMGVHRETYRPFGKKFDRFHDQKHLLRT